MLLFTVNSFESLPLILYVTGVTLDERDVVYNFPSEVVLVFSVIVFGP